MLNTTSIEDIQKIIKAISIDTFFKKLINNLSEDFSHWEKFIKTARNATHVDGGVIELMPVCSDEYYAFKYVNGHPRNTQENKLNVVAIGMLTDVKTGYPLLLSEMTLLTALRTAAVSALASMHLAREDADKIGIIGCGAQSEFQILAHLAYKPFSTVYYYDIDPMAMEKFAANLADTSLTLVACHDIPSTLQHADIAITATAAKKQQCLFDINQCPAGLHINAIGGDCPKKTELPAEMLHQCKVVVEYLPQTLIEGEIQQAGTACVDASLWQIITKEKTGRDSQEQITLFDSVGFALEDYSVLRLVYELTKTLNITTPLNMIPNLTNPKDLYSLIRDA